MYAVLGAIAVILAGINGTNVGVIAILVIVAGFARKGKVDAIIVQAKGTVAVIQCVNVVIVAIDRGVGTNIFVEVTFIRCAWVHVVALCVRVTGTRRNVYTTAAR